MERSLPLSEQTDAQAGWNENTEEALGCGTTLHETELFGWPLPLLPAMEKTTEPKSPNFLFRVGDAVDRCLDEEDDKFALKEMFQYANPLTKSILRKIKRIARQPNMTADDRQQLHHYEESYRRVSENSLPKLPAEAGVYLFKLVLVDHQAVDFETKCSVQYASDSISYEKDASPNASFALANVMLHDLSCECTDGIYGWLSRLWPWQELMLASSPRFVWGLGESKWARREYLNEPVKQDEKQLPGKSCSLSSAWARAKKEGRKIKKSINRSITDLSTFEQPIAKLLNELTKRNTESVIIPKEESASLSMVNYLCTRLLCGAEVYMPRASQVEPLKCLKVLQQIASTGRKGGRLYDCYYAAAAFIHDSTFLLEKKKSIAKQMRQDERDNVLDELELRRAYIRLYEREHDRLRLPDSEVLHDPDRLLQAYAELYHKRNDEKEYFRSTSATHAEDAGLQQAYIELYHNAHNTTLVEYTGAPLANTKRLADSQLDFFKTPIVWITHERLDFSRIGKAPLTLSMERQLRERMEVASLVLKTVVVAFLTPLSWLG